MGKKFRQHFIAVEEAWNSPDKIMERALAIAHSRAVEAERGCIKTKVLEQPPFHKHGRLATEIKA
jgi:hypothetical protein